MEPVPVVDKLSMALSDIVASKKVKTNNAGQNPSKQRREKALNQQKSRANNARENKQLQKRVGLNFGVKKTIKTEKPSSGRKLVMPMAHNAASNGPSKQPPLKNQLRIQITNTTAQSRLNKEQSPNYRVAQGSSATSKPRQTPRFRNRPSNGSGRFKQSRPANRDSAPIMPGSNW